MFRIGYKPIKQKDVVSSYHTNIQRHRVRILKSFAFFFIALKRSYVRYKFDLYYIKSNPENFVLVFLYFNAF